MTITLKTFEETLEYSLDPAEYGIVKAKDPIFLDGLSIRLDKLSALFPRLNLDKIKKIIKKNPLLNKLYKEGRLYISSKLRKTYSEVIEKNKELKEKCLSKLKILESIPEAELTPENKKEKEQNQKMLLIHEQRIKVLTKIFLKPEDQKVEDILSRVEKELIEYQNNELASKYLLNTLEAIDKLSPEGEKLAVHIELFPRLKDAGGRSDAYFPKDKCISFCPLNFEDSGLPARITPETLFGHEFGHVMDYIRNRIYQSPEKLQEYCVESDLSEKGLKQSLKYAAELYSGSTLGIRLYSYNWEGLVKDGLIDKECKAAVEFVSFHTEDILFILNKSSDEEDFKQKYDSWIKQKSNYIAERFPGFTLRDKWFALGIRKAFMNGYIEAADNEKVQSIMKKLDNVFEENINDTLYEIIQKDINLSPIMSEITDYLKKCADEFKENKKIKAAELEKIIKELVDSKFDELYRDDVKKITSPDSAKIKKAKNEAKETFSNRFNEEFNKTFDEKFDETSDKTLRDTFDEKFEAIKEQIEDIFFLPENYEYYESFGSKLRSQIKKNLTGIPEQKKIFIKSLMPDLDKIITETIEEKIEAHNKKVDSNPISSIIDEAKAGDVDTPAEHRAREEQRKKIAAEMMEKLRVERENINKLKQDARTGSSPEKDEYKRQIEEEVRKIVNNARAEGVDTRGVEEGWQKEWEEAFETEFKFREALEPGVVERDPIGIELTIRGEPI